MAKKAILLNTPARVKPGEGLQHLKENTPDEMRKYCAHNGYEIATELSAEQEFLYEKETVLATTILKIAEEGHEVVIVSAQQLAEQVQGDKIDLQLASLVSQNRLKSETLVHPCFVAPVGSNRRIWRYLSLPKFLDLLQSSCLHFTRIDEMQKFDAHEGISSTVAMKKYIEDVRQGVKPPPYPDMTPTQFVQMFGRADIDANLSKWFFVNCWHMSDHENFAMWKIYSEQFGVCIESQYENLRDCFTDLKWSYYSNKYKVYIGTVSYFNTETEFIRRDNVFWTLLSKRREYVYETELRCIISDYEQPSSVRPKVDLAKLINSIRVNPEAPEWYQQSIVDLCNKYGMGQKLITRSSLQL